MLHGRTKELARLDEMLDAVAASQSRVAVVHGEAGAGKTALLDEAQNRAQARGLRVLRARGVEAEAELAHAALHQLLRPLLGDLERLAAPQAAALRSAFGLAAGDGSDRFLISLAALELLTDAATRTPLLCVVDDAHWLDGASLDVLLFVARRLHADAAGLLLATRADPATPEFETIRLDGLRRDDIAGLLAAQGREAGADVVAWLARTTGGNPLAIQDACRALTAEQLAGDAPPPAAPPIGESARRAHVQRVGELPASARQLLLVAAAEERGDLPTILGAARRLGVDTRALDDLEAAGLVRWTGDALEFSHPLVRQAVYEAAPLSRRISVHSGLADELAEGADGDRALWHRAAAAVGADERIAADLVAAATRAREHGAHADASQALERAARLEASPEARARRLLQAAEDALHGGAVVRARALAGGAREASPHVEAPADFVIGRCEIVRGVPEAGARVLLDAAAPDRGLPEAARVDALLAALEGALLTGDPDLLLRISLAAAWLDAGDDALRLRKLVLQGVGAYPHADCAQAADRLRAAIELADALGDDDAGLRYAGLAAAYIGDAAAAAALHGRAVSAARRRGCPQALARALEHVAPAELWSGQVPVALADADEGLRLAEEQGLQNASARLAATLAQIAAFQGREDACRAHAQRALDLGGRRGLTAVTAAASQALAALDLAAGRHDEALVRLEGLFEGARHPIAVLQLVPDLVEAAVRAGRPAVAGPALELLDEWVDHAGSEWARPLAVRSRALLAEGEQATALYRSALELHAGLDRPIEEARTRLLFGEHLRRQRRRVDAREQLRAALEAFERLGGPAWAERARRELRASGQVARRRDPVTLDDLTPQELQVARYVARGLSNKEVARELFLSPRTIDFHLGNIFAKLGLRSRTELAHHAFDELDAPAPERAPAAGAR